VVVLHRVEYRSINLCYTESGKHFHMCIILPSFMCASPGMLDINFFPLLELFTFFVLKYLCRVLFGAPEYGVPLLEVGHWLKWTRGFAQFLKVIRIVQVDVLL